MSLSLQNAIHAMMAQHDANFSSDENNITLACRQHAHIAITTGVNQTIEGIVFQHNTFICSFDFSKSRSYQIMTVPPTNRRIMSDQEIQLFAFHLFSTLTPLQIVAIKSKMLSCEPRLSAHFDLYSTMLQMH